MNKFTIAKALKADKLNNDNPVLYKIHIGTKYYLHKGKTLYESANQFLETIFRGMRGKSCLDAYSNVVAYCNKFPAIYSVTLEVVLNSTPDKVLAMEDKLYKTMKKDELSLNRLDIPPYKPEWMIRQVYQERCKECLTHILYGAKGEPSKKMVFKFCPNCGKPNTKKI